MVTERNFGVGCRSSEWNNRSEKSEIRSEKHRKTGKWTLRIYGISGWDFGVSGWDLDRNFGGDFGVDYRSSD